MVVVLSGRGKSTQNCFQRREGRKKYNIQEEEGLRQVGMMRNMIGIRVFPGIGDKTR